MLSFRWILDFKYSRFSFFHSSSFRSNRHIFVDLSFPHIVKVKFSLICHWNSLWSLFIYKELSKVESLCLTLCDFNFRVLYIDWMMNSVPNSFNIQNKRSCLLLHITHNVEIVWNFFDWLEYDFDWNLALRRNDSCQRIHSQRIFLLRTAFNAFFWKAELKWNMLLIDYVDDFSVFASEQKRAKVDFAWFKKYDWFNDMADY